HVDNEIARLSGNHTAHGWVGVDHDQATRLFNRAHEHRSVLWKEVPDWSPHVADIVKIVAVTGAGPIFVRRQVRSVEKARWRPTRAYVPAAIIDHDVQG